MKVNLLNVRSLASCHDELKELLGANIVSLDRTKLKVVIHSILDLLRNLHALEYLTYNLTIFFDLVVFVGLVNIVENVGELTDKITNNEEASEHESGRYPEDLELGRTDVVTHDVEKCHENH